MFNPSCGTVLLFMLVQTLEAFGFTIGATQYTSLFLKPSGKEAQKNTLGELLQGAYGLCDI